MVQFGSMDRLNTPDYNILPCFWCPVWCILTILWTPIPPVPRQTQTKRWQFWRNPESGNTSHFSLLDFRCSSAQCSKPLWFFSWTSSLVETKWIRTNWCLVVIIMSWFGRERLETSKQLFCICFCKKNVTWNCKKSVSELMGLGRL